MPVTMYAVIYLATIVAYSTHSVTLHSHGVAPVDLLVWATTGRATTASMAYYVPV